MSKKQKEQTGPLAAQDFEVKSAAINDGICNYSIHVKEGIAIGTHSVKGEGLVDADMEIAFSKFNVHLAIIDGVFRHKGIEIEKLGKFYNHEITNDYMVTGFKMKGEEDNLSIVLVGSKNVSAGRMDIETPKMMLDNMGGYEFYKELKAAAQEAIMEVELYIRGKFTPIEQPEIDNPRQLKLGDAIEEAEKELEGARVK